jgi:hypothetical protein
MRRSSLVVLLVVGALLVPLAVFAAHRFDDVPNSHTFHTAIGWMKDNNITVGCNPPANTNYCPEDNVTRGQMATFMKRLAENNVVDAATLDGLDSADFYTRAQVDEKFATSGIQTLGAGSFTAPGTTTWTNGCARDGAAPFTVRASVQLPVGAVITGFTGYIFDSDAAANSSVQLRRVNVGNTLIGTVTSSGTGLQNVSADLATAESVDANDYFNLEYVGANGTINHQICGASVEYQIPGGSSLLGGNAPDDGPGTGTE